MSKIDFILSNPGHHAAMMQPVLERLKDKGGYQCRVLSLCEFRGFASPVEQFQMADAFICIPSRQMRSSSASGKQSDSRHSRWLRQTVRQVSWYSLMQRPFRQALATPPHLVILPNDAAFPYNHIVRLLHQRHIPFMLLQEGIRFHLPHDEEGEVYGSGGAAVIAAWGEGSATYFRAQGVPPHTIHCTGNPRFDKILNTDWQPQADQLKSQHGFGRTNLLLLSNPIDDQGFCTTAEKMALIHRFLSEIVLLFTDPDFHLIIKLHPRESVAAFQATADVFPFHSQITVLGPTLLYPLFKLAQAAIVLASTAGLEALLFDLPLAVLEIPGAGFVHDYVSSGAAVGLSWERPFGPQLNALLSQSSTNKEKSQQYLQHALVFRQNSTGQVVTLVEQFASKQ
ncbi:MAG: hypothetical protein KJ069_09405 [Anaerolineae bacterium]|nr:hypothetical protein [Anaerolineae bacterium]